MSEVNSNPNDVDRALAAFGSAPIKYRSFGKHLLRPAAAHQILPAAIVDDTVYDPFGPQPVVHALDEARSGVLLPANLPDPTHLDLTRHVSASHIPAPPIEAAQVPAYVPADPFVAYEPHHEPPPLEIPAYGVPEANSEALLHPVAVEPDPFAAPFHTAPAPELTPVEASEAVHYQPMLPQEARYEAPHEAAASIQEPALRPSTSDVVYPAPPGDRPRMRVVSLPVETAPVQPQATSFQVPPFAGPIISSLPASAPSRATGPETARVPETAATAMPPLPPASSPSAPVTPAFVLPTLGSQMTAREQGRIGGDTETDTVPRSIAEMFRVLNGRPEQSRRPVVHDQSDDVSLFRRL